ncbi:hypothetical protein [Vibrio tasmaniensis]|uniref:Uncharacterized protein n=1 Tax=Vibrio splendidus TaxID=29497 RepID=A0A0H3ZQF5_VIBSP|nr:hypothetical protein [Vibrio tasmaniensis]AKN36144.1 hypothetical protein [Vibrio splendidus]
MKNFIQIATYPTAFIAWIARKVGYLDDCSGMKKNKDSGYFAITKDSSLNSANHRRL